MRIFFHKDHPRVIFSYININVCFSEFFLLLKIISKIINELALINYSKIIINELLLINYY